MKKFLLLLLGILLLSGCSKKIEKFSLEDEYYEKAGIIEINNEELLSLEVLEKNFAVFVHIDGCTSCADFKEVLRKFSEKYNITFYSTSALSVDDKCIKGCVKYSPSVVLFKDGDVVDYLDAVSNEDIPYYESAEGFENWFTKYVYLKD